MVHWMIGVHLVDQPDLIRFPTVNAQSNGTVHCTGLPVDELPKLCCSDQMPDSSPVSDAPLETIAVIMAGGFALRRGGNSVGGNQLHAALRAPGWH